MREQELLAGVAGVEHIPLSAFTSGHVESCRRYGRSGMSWVAERNSDVDRAVVELLPVFRFDTLHG